jgi:hypothetical protein
MAEAMTTQISVWLPAELRREIEARARKERRSLSNCVACIIADHIAKPAGRAGSGADAASAAA